MFQILKCRFASHLKFNAMVKPFSSSNVSWKNSCSDKPHSNCWNCKKLLNCVEDKFFCLNCEMIQPPIKCVDYFQYLDLGEPSYDVNLTNLTTKFRKLQHLLHPDRFTNKTQIEQNYSAQQASLVNKAYRTLLEPLPRALYLLELFGNPLNETGGEVTDKTFLVDMLDLNENVNESTDLNYIKNIGEEMSRTLHSLQNEFKVALDNKNYVSARNLVVKMKFFETVKTNVNKKLGFN